MNNIDPNAKKQLEVTQDNKVRFVQYINNEAVKKNIEQALGSEARALRFVSSVSSAVQANAQLAECEKATILNAALLGEALNLSPSASLGQYFIVPYKDRNKAQKQATFQLGYKGYVQLAIRSGEYQKLNVTEVKEGEFVEWDRINEELTLNSIKDEGEWAKTPTVGYYAYFVTNNGFKKAMYWTREHMEKHAKEYSKAYSKGQGFWATSFDEMAKKTMLRQLISKWGIMSIEMQRAYQNDMAVVGDATGETAPEYIDNPEAEPIDVESTTL